MSVAFGKLGDMARLHSVPEWVCPPLRAVANIELFLLAEYRRTRAPQALGSWVSLSWLGAGAGERTPGPLGEGLPSEAVAWSSMLVADALAEGEPYPPSEWWAAHEIAPADRFTSEAWELRASDSYVRHYMHGAVVALGWLLGDLTDPRLMAPVFNGVATRIPAAERELCRARLWALSESTQPATAG
ncbi:MAG: hypothetical protein J0I34_33350 [Pseudonocardia sp.]|uniref:hypothetical protein n=1 Tax=unclassified Pseudonocardia TaxID=2619320 RepID=UPI001AD53B73|nr:MULTISPECIES: hypothetical protein [unclassified Pseudonocardia]MBN9113648.1 hypothetical protein [Pseudonocardia sp.]